MACSIILRLLKSLIQFIFLCATGLYLAHIHFDVVAKEESIIIYWVLGLGEGRTLNLGPSLAAKDGHFACFFG